MNDLISVIVPVYNTEKYLNRCVDSILCQTYSNLELILVNDGSTDNSLDICNQYKAKDNRVKVIDKENGGLSSARNAGLDVATGDYIAFCDSDDYLPNDAYESLIKAISTTDGAIANGMYVRASESGELTKSKVIHEKDEDIPPKDFLKELLMHVGDVSMCTKLIPRNLIGDLRFPEGILNEDLVFMVNLLKKVTIIKFVGRLCYYYFVRQNSISSKYGKAFEDMQKNSLWLLELVKNDYPTLKKYAIRFAAYQNMAYLLVLPKELRNKGNQAYRSAKIFLRKNIFKCIFNKYLRIKEKVIILGLFLFPNIMAEKYQKKHR
ncbi:MAG: glycosyltransferase [Clostridia bacterium]|nr:glycosyltransferase [Clostridia bacterium]